MSTRTPHKQGTLVFPPGVRVFVAQRVPWYSNSTKFKIRWWG
jgi:hypothetical protein